MSDKDFFIHSYEKRVIDAVHKVFANEERIMKNDEYIVVFHELPYSFDLCILEDVVAKGLQKKSRLPIISFQDGVERKSCSELDAAFQIQCVEMPHNDISKNDISEIIAETFKDKKRIFELEYRGIKYGEFLYDHILRNQLGKSFDWNCIDKDVFSECLIKALNYIDNAFELFEKYPPKYIVLMEWVYLKGLVVKVAQKLGAQVLMANNDHPDKLVLIDSNQTIGDKIKIQDIIKRYVESSKPKVNNLDDVFVMKNSIYKNEWQSNGKKNVFIMLHALGDVPRTGSHMLVYDDYNDWYVDTIKKISKITNVNWYIKDHPQSNWYGQDKYVKEVFEKNKNDNILWCDKEISGMTIKNVADCIITVAGDVGVEYWSYGVPTISLSDTHYTDWGISYQARSKEEYYKLLENIENIPEVSREQMQNAKMYMNLYASSSLPEDKFAEIIKNTRKQILASYKKGDNAAYPVQYNFSVNFIDYMNNNNIYDSICYTFDNIIEVK